MLRLTSNKYCWGVSVSGSRSRKQGDLRLSKLYAGSIAETRNPACGRTRRTCKWKLCFPTLDPTL